MKRSQAIRIALSLTWLVVIVGGLLVWLFRPTGTSPEVQLRAAASVAGFLLLIAAGAGVAAMATVQFWKVLFLPRGTFHAGELDSVFGKSMNQVLGLAGPTQNESTSDYSDSLHKYSDSLRKQESLNYLLDNPTEVLMGQIRSGADYILLRPEGFEDALYRLAGDAGQDSVKKYLAQREEQSTNTSPSDAASSLPRSNDALIEVRFFVEQRLNLVHVRLKEGWRRRVRIVAVAVAGLTGLLTVIMSDLGPTTKISVVFVAVIWGGFFSWLARDVVALVERRRT